MTYINELLDTLDLSEFYLDDENMNVDEVWVDSNSIDDIEVDSEQQGVFLHSKWILDGADTLSEAAELARTYADFLEQLQGEGYVLMDTIEDGNGFALAPESM